MTIAPARLDHLLDGVRARAEASGVFGPVELRAGTLVCRAIASAAPASYRLYADGGRLWVALVMADRWLSESIESDLMHTGDSVEELLAEELAEVGVPAGTPVVEHFRSEDLLFTFRSPVPVSAASSDAEAIPVAAGWLLAYEAAFRNLGDMSAGDG